MAGDVMSEKAYEEYVVRRFDEAAESDAPIIFTNRGTPHAKAVLEQIIVRAKNTIDLFTGCLSAAVYNPLLLREALTRGVAIRIIISDDIPFKESSALERLKKEGGSARFNVRYAGDLIKTNPKLPFDHFAIGDGKHLRAEKDAKDRSATVILNAEHLNDGKAVSSYKAFFDGLWRLSPHWQMPETV